MLFFSLFPVASLYQIAREVYSIFIMKFCQIMQCLNKYCPLLDIKKELRRCIQNSLIKQASFPSVNFSWNVYLYLTRSSNLLVYSLLFIMVFIKLNTFSSFTYFMNSIYLVVCDLKLNNEIQDL